MALKTALCAVFSDIKVMLNPEKPRRGSFECVLTKENGTSVTLWSGLKLGPPRKLKFPENDHIVKLLQAEL